MTSGRHKAHHTHEVSDAFADGWDARLQWQPGKPEPANPFDVPPGSPRKQSEVRQRARQREILQWAMGWQECDADMRRGDLAPVGEADFKRRAPLTVEDFDSAVVAEEDSEEDD